MRIDQEPQARLISLFPSCAPTPVISPMLIKVGTAEWRLRACSSAVFAAPSGSAAPAPCRQLEVKPVRARRSAAQPGHAGPVQIFVQAGSASLPAAASSASSETSDGMSSASAW